MMERSAFEYLFMHANSLAELGLHQGLMALLADDAASAPPGPGADSADLEALQLAQLTAMMQGASGANALDEVLARAGQLAEHAPFQDQIIKEMAAARPAALADQQAGAANRNQAEDELNETSGDKVNNAPDRDMPIDLDQYLNRVYAAKDDVAALMSNAMAAIDLEELATLIDCLPQELPPLTEPLTAAGLAQWLDCYHSEDFALHEIIGSITAHMPGNRPT